MELQEIKKSKQYAKEEILENIRQFNKEEWNDDEEESIIDEENGLKQLEYII